MNYDDEYNTNDERWNGTQFVKLNIDFKRCCAIFKSGCHILHDKLYLLQATNDTSRSFMCKLVVYACYRVWYFDFLLPHLDGRL